MKIHCILYMRIRTIQISINLSNISNLYFDATSLTVGPIILPCGRDKELGFKFNADNYIQGLDELRSVRAFAGSYSPPNPDSVLL